MLKRIINNIKYDITGNYAQIFESYGRYKALVYLSKVSLMLCKAVVLNKKKNFQNIDFYDTW